MTYSQDFEKIELMLTAAGPRESVGRELQVLFGQCGPSLSPEVAAETNFYERCKILANNQHRFSGDLRARVVAFIRKYGTFVQNPAEVAEFLAEFLNDLIPKHVLGRGRAV